MWKWLLIWISDALFTLWPFFAQSESPIDYAFKTAGQASTLTDRALWLFMLGIILTIAYALDKQKSKRIAKLESREELVIKTLADAVDIMEKLKRKLPEE